MKQTLILDSSQIAAFDECEQKHNYEYTQSLIQINKFNPSESNRVPDKMSFGTLGHKYLEIYYTQLGYGVNESEALRRALIFDPDAEDKVDPEFPLSQELRLKVRERFRDYVLHYSTIGDYQIAHRAARRIEVLDDYLVDVSFSEPIVEQGFSYELYNTSEYLFVLEGRLDLLAQTHGETLFVDHKWQLNKRDLYPKSIQFRNYSLATGLYLGIINYVRLHDKIDKTTFVREPICFSPGDISAWKTELIDIYVRMAKSIQTGNLIMRRSACGGKFRGAFCPYTPLCESYDLRQREAIKNQNYTKKKEWKPW